MRGRPPVPVKKPLRRMQLVRGFVKLRSSTFSTRPLERHMAYVSTAPAAIAAAATQLEGIGNSFSAESSAAAAPTTAGGAGIPAASTPVTLASQSWTAAPGAMSTGSPGTMAGMPAVAAAPASEPRATASSPRSCRRSPSRHSPKNPRWPTMADVNLKQPRRPTSRGDQFRIRRLTSASPGRNGGQIHMFRHALNEPTALHKS